MKSKQLLAMVCALASASSVFAAGTVETITFDDAPINNTDLGNFYPNVTFGADEQVQSQTLPEFPAHSGTQFLTGANILNPDMSFSFSSPVTGVSFWYVSLAGFSGTATLSDGSTINLTGVQNTSTPGSGTPTKLVINTTLGVTGVTITDPTTLGGGIAIDDLVFTTSAPDAASTLALLGVAAAGLVAIRRKIVTQ